LRTGLTIHEHTFSGRKKGGRKGDHDSIVHHCRSGTANAALHELKKRMRIPADQGTIDRAKVIVAEEALGVIDRNEHGGL
jgi:hypothetical protein